MHRKQEKKENGLVFGRYLALQELGRGAMATVYLANDPNLNRLVAIKVIHGHLDTNKTIRARFWMEAQAIASLRNPHIVEIFDYAEKDGSPFIVMEFVDGNNLGKILDHLNMEAMPQEIAASLVAQAAEALAIAKKHSIVHRDIKPENMMVDVQGYLKVADFGIAKMSQESLTQTGNIIGTPTYMSPEQVLGRGGISSQSDIFSLGIVFYHLLTGTRPFKADSIQAVMRKILEEAHVPAKVRNPSVDKVLSDLVDILLNKDPAQRGNGPEWLLSELKRYLVKKEVIDPIQEVKLFIDRSFAIGPDFKTAREVDMVEVEIEMAKKTGVKTWSALAPALGIRPSPGQILTSQNRKGRWLLWSCIGISIPGLVGLIFFLFGSFQSVQVSKTRVEIRPVSITVVPRIVRLKVGETTTLQYLVDPPTSSREVRWISEDTSIASIQSPGVVLAKKPGTVRFAVIHAKVNNIRGLASITVEEPITYQKSFKEDNMQRPPSKQLSSPVNPRHFVQRLPNPSSSESSKGGTLPASILLNLDIKSKPPFAEIVVDGISWGTTPINQREVMSGKHHVQVSFGTRNLDTTVHILPGMTELWFKENK